MDNVEQLYRAILENPAEDILRLIYADALEEAGASERAAFIRTQVMLQRYPEYDPVALRIRYTHASAQPDPAWLGDWELPEGVNWATEPYRRGLPGAIEVRDGATFLRHAADVLARYPIESLEFRVVRVGEARALADCPLLQQITTLTFPQGTSGQVIGPLLASEYFTRLKELRLGSQFTTAATVAAVVNSAVFPQLTSLAIRNDSRAGGPLAGELARLTAPPQLRRLDLSGNRLSADVLARLVVSPAVQTVEELHLSDNNLGASGITALATGTLPALRSLHLARTRPQEAGVNTLTHAPFFRNLRHLSLSGNNLGSTAAIALAKASADHLHVLNLSDNRIGNRGLAALAQSPQRDNLLVLNLANCRINDEGLTAILKEPRLSQFLHLDLSGSLLSESYQELLQAHPGVRVQL
ncbi:MAG: TIGR02996 domain-containing protein [Gemmataceae bacterium]|nr:TIGR02996 domain-containing protein [Gemmata sp.]MDW8198421.1 TIGR02996 domain-containing protein [Gemmataceae bacterium]